MGDSTTPITREELLRAEAESYRRRLKDRQVELQSRRERAYEALQQREEARLKEARSYLFGLSWRASYRDSVRAREREEKDSQVQLLRLQAELYRQRLRRYMRPEQLGEEPS